MFVLTCHPAQDPRPILRENFPGKKFHELVFWGTEISDFFKRKVSMWAKKIDTKDTILVIHSADRLSVPTMSLITGTCDKGMERTIVFIVQSPHRLPYSILRKSTIIRGFSEPPLAPGWVSHTPSPQDYTAWEKLLME